MLDFILQCKSIEINMIHRTSHMGIFNVKISNADATFKKTSEAKYLDGSIKEVTINDITNYPNTIDSNLYYN